MQKQNHFVCFISQNICFCFTSATWREYQGTQIRPQRIRNYRTDS